MFQDWLERLRAFWSANRRNQALVVVSGVVLIVLITGSIALANRSGGASTGGITQTTATSTTGVTQPTATTTGAPQPTATIGTAVTPLPTKPVNQAIIGGTETGFTAVYGAPIGTGVDSGNNLPTVDYKGSGPVGDITIELDSASSYVVGVVVSAQKDTPWDATAVKAICPHFAPTDAAYDPVQSITNGSNQDVALFQLGHSPLLANSLPSGVFADSQGAAVTSGTFSTQIYYIDGSDGRLAYACSLRLGNQPSSPPTS